MIEPGAQKTVTFALGPELEKLCRYLTDPANGVWPATVLEVAEYISGRRKE